MSADLSRTHYHDEVVNLAAAVAVTGPDHLGIAIGQIHLKRSRPTEKLRPVLTNALRKESPFVQILSLVLNLHAGQHDETAELVRLLKPKGYDQAMEEFINCEPEMDAYQH